MKKCFFAAMVGNFLLAAPAVAGDSAEGEKFSKVQSLSLRG